MNNIEKIKQALQEFECDALMLTSPVNRLYATGFSSSAGVLLVTEGDVWFFTDTRYIEAARNTVKGTHVLLVTNNDYPEQIKPLLDDNNITSVGFEEAFVTHSFFVDWKEKLEKEFVPAQKLLNDLRARKTSEDLEGMKKAQRIAEKSFQEILPLISYDITEKQLAAELVYRCVMNGADDKAFDAIVVSGSKSSMPHGVPGDVMIGPGFLTFDFGARLDGWCSDTTRTVCLGKPDDEMIKVYNTVLEAQTAGINALRAGVSGFDVDAAARVVIEDAGYGEFFGHGFGHTIGLEVHESLKASRISEDILPAGAVITAEPGIYLPGRFGVRIEDMLFITEDGFENLTTLPKNLVII